MINLPVGEGGTKLTWTEAWYLLWRGFQGDRAEFEAIRKDAEAFGLEHREDGGEGHIDGHGDAARHAYWNARMTQEYGEEWTRKFGIAHEQRASNTAHEEAMDLYNNEVGRRIGEEHPDATPDELKALVEKAYDNGELLVIGPDGEIIWSDQLPPTKHYEHTGEPADGRYRGNVGREDYGR